MENLTTQTATPFVKWVGGKRGILGQILSRFPSNYTEYYEPFVGGGAVFFAGELKNSHLSDTNERLMNAYIIVRDSPEALIEQLRRHAKEHCPDYYYISRERMNSEADPLIQAGLFIYLNKTCYNGLYRVNSKGGFNVPVGSYKNPAILEENIIRNCSAKLQGVSLLSTDFTEIPIQKDAFYYLDPPYYGTYSGYSPGGFNEIKQKELVDFCNKIDSSGGYFMLSNSSTEFIRQLYKGNLIEEVSAPRSVACKTTSRRNVNELIIRNYK